MRIVYKGMSLWLLLSKLIKITRIKLGFLLPTMQAKFVLGLLECPYGKNFKVCGKVYFRSNRQGTLTFGDNVSLTSRFLTNTVGITNPIMLECIGNGRIEIGNNSGVTSTIISARTSVKIGKYVKIGGNVRIYDHDFHSLAYQYRRNGQEDFKHVKTAEVIIEDDVFIGTNAIILKGVHIGARSVVGAGSVVTCKNIPPDSLVMGNPAIIIHKESESCAL